jgi:hypothetical protein
LVFLVSHHNIADCSQSLQGGREGGREGGGKMGGREAEEGGREMGRGGIKDQGRHIKLRKFNVEV